MNPTTNTPVLATAFVLVLGTILLFLVNTLPALISASVLLPALIYVGILLVYVFTRRQQAELDATEDEQQRRERFTLGRWVTPVLTLAFIWLALEVWVLIGPQFRTAQLYLLENGGRRFGLLRLHAHTRARVTAAAQSTTPRTPKDKVRKNNL